MGFGHRFQYRFGRRSTAIRAVLPVVTIVLDDTETAVAYFKELKREIKAKITLNVKAAPHAGASPNDVLKYAIELAAAITADEAEEGDSTWALIDMEAEEYKQSQALRAQRTSEGRKVNVLLSNPCYEIWTLAHLIDTGEAFKDCAAVVARIKAEWRRKFGTVFGSKSQADYAKLIPFRDDAVKNSKKRNPIRDPSWTEVFKVIEHIKTLCSKT